MDFEIEFVFFILEFLFIIEVIIVILEFFEFCESDVIIMEVNIFVNMGIRMFFVCFIFSVIGFLFSVVSFVVLFKNVFFFFSCKVVRYWVSGF